MRAIPVFVSLISMSTGCSPPRSDAGGDWSPSAGSTKASETEVWDAFDDFPSSSNAESDTWQYGSMDLLKSFTAYEVLGVACGGLDIWSHRGNLDPNVNRNPTGVDYEPSSCSGILFPGDDFLHVHPGATDNVKRSVVRFVAPSPNCA